MWWLRELRYSVFGKLLMGAVVIGIVGGLGYFGYISYSDDNGDQPVVAVADGETAALPKTTLQQQCENAKGKLQRIVDQTLKFSSVNAAQSNNAFKAYAEAVRTCTYNEFYEFEREVIVPWATGQDMFTAAQVSGDLEPAGGRDDE
jgi:hypothetical protein